MAKFKFFLSLHCLFFFFLSFPGVAQNNGGGIKAGTSLAVLTGVINYDANFRFGPSIGIFGYARPTRGIAIQPEISYSIQGSKNSYPFNRNIEGGTRTDLHYLNIPLILKINLSDFLFCQFGPQLGVLLDAKEKGSLKYYGGGTSRTETINVKTTSLYAANDFSVIGGIGINISPKMVFSARYAHGINNIDKDPRHARFRSSGAPLSNRVFEFSIYYNFRKDIWQTPLDQI